MDDPPFSIPYRSLRYEMNPFLETGLMKEVGKDHLPEISLNLGASGERVSEILGLFPN